MNANEVFMALPHLSGAELRDVHMRASALLSIGPKTDVIGPARGEDSFVRDLYIALGDLLQKRICVRSMPFHVFIKQAAYQQFLPAAQFAEEANGQWFPKQNKAERLSMVMLYARLVLDDIASRSQPAVWRVISAAVLNLPQIVDQAFPGYAEAGLLGIIHRLRTQKVKA